MQRREVQRLEEELQELDTRLEGLREQVRRDKDEHFESMRQAARLQNDAVSYRAQVDNLSREHQRLRQRSEQAAEHLASLDVELQELTAADEALQARLGGARRTLAEHARRSASACGQARDETAQLAADLRAQRSGLASRIEVLEGLERSHEGLGAGVREVFALLEQPDPGPWRTVVGIVADFLTVRREYAPLIDLALGERAQRFLVRDPDLLAQALRQRRAAVFRPRQLPAACRRPACATAERAPATRSVGRHRLPPGSPANHAASGPRVLAPAEQLVRCDDPELADLPRRLLGRTLIVRDLAAARAVAAPAGTAVRCVTLQGELLEADGTLTVGTHHAEAGILSRKSELRELREQQVALDRRHGGAGARPGRPARARGGAGRPHRPAAAGDRRAGRPGGRPARADRPAAAAPRGPARGSGGQPRGDQRAGAGDRAAGGGVAAGARRGGRGRGPGAGAADAAGDGRARNPRGRRSCVSGGSRRRRRQGGAGPGRGTPDGAARPPRPARGRPRPARPRARAGGAARWRRARVRRDENQRTLLQTSASLAAWYLRKEEAESGLAEHAGRARPARGEKRPHRRGGAGQPQRLARSARSRLTPRAGGQRPAPPPRRARATGCARITSSTWPNCTQAGRRRRAAGVSRRRSASPAGGAQTPALRRPLPIRTRPRRRKKSPSCGAS